jgi:hypothetical protein
MGSSGMVLQIYYHCYAFVVARLLFKLTLLDQLVVLFWACHASWAALR